MNQSGSKLTEASTDRSLSPSLKRPLTSNSNYVRGGLSRSQQKLTCSSSVLTGAARISEKVQREMLVSLFQRQKPENRDDRYG